MAEMGPWGIRHQVSKRLAAQMNQVLVVARFEVHLGLLQQGGLYHHIDPVGSPTAGIAPRSQSENAARSVLRQHFQVTRQHLVDLSSSRRWVAGDTAKQVAVFVAQQDRLGDLITRHMRHGRRIAGIGMWMPDDLV